MLTWPELTFPPINLWVMPAMTDDVLFNEYDIPYDYCPQYTPDDEDDKTRIMRLEAQICDLRRENEELRTELSKGLKKAQKGLREEI